ncbi:hypothetical protein GCM10007984_02760 [Shewanella putrefaciens]|nr:hypothetical protein GCM10007984_02760 [Shewanella putrefaciens]
MHVKRLKDQPILIKFDYISNMQSSCDIVSFQENDDMQSPNQDGLFYLLTTYKSVTLYSV